MKLEDQLRDSLDRNTRGVGLSPGRFDEVERRVRRSHARRTALGSVAGAFVIAALALVVPRLATTDDPGFANPPDEPKQPGIANGIATFREEYDRFQFTFPADWRVGGFEGSIELNPPGLPGLTVGEETFAVELMVLYDERYDRTEEMFPGVDFTDTTLAGKQAVRAEIAEARDGGTRRLIHRIDWTGISGCPRFVVCDTDPYTLQVLVFASTDDLYSTYKPDAERLLDSMVLLRGEEYPEGSPVYSRRGHVPETMTFDDFTATLMDFMDDRAAGRPAGHPTPDTLVGTYEVIQREDLSSESVRFTVSIQGDGTSVETIRVGPDGIHVESES